MAQERTLIGGEEWCALPQLGIDWVKARVDSGARTSSLHAWHIRRFTRGGRDWVSFRVHPLQRDRRTVIDCEAPLADHRGVKSSSGATESRYVIRTRLSLAGESFDIELTLTGRDAMGYRMLLGREAMQDRFLVDPARAQLLPAPSDEDIEAAYAGRRMAVPHLNIVLLALGSGGFAGLVRERAAVRGHRCHVVDPTESRMLYREGHEFLQGEFPQDAGIEAGAHLDAVVSLLPRARAETATVLLGYFAHLGALSPNTARAIHGVLDRSTAWQRLSRSGIPLPVTRWLPGKAADRGDPDDFARCSLTIVRPTMADVAVCLTGEAAKLPRGASANVPASGGAVLVQGLPGGGELLRCYVAGPRAATRALEINPAGVLAVGRRRAGALDREARRAVRRAVRALGLNHAVVDVYRDNHGIVILDVDPFTFPAPGSQAATRYADALIAHVERMVGHR